MIEKMKFDQLEYFGIPSYITRLWKKHYSSALLPIQEKAVRNYHLLQSDGTFSGYQQLKNEHPSDTLLVISPSASGKTLVGEMAAIQEILFQRKVIYLVPLRALAEEKYHHFADLYRSIGMKVKISSRDHRQDDQDIIQGNFHIAVIVYEKFYYLFLRYPQLPANISLLVADEIQLINDPERGPRLENILRYLQNHHPAIRIIALSAFLENAACLAEWLDADVLYSHYRPIEIRKGIVRKGVYRYLEHNTHIPGQEIFFPEDQSEECSLANYLKLTLDYLVQQDETSMIFFSTKTEVRVWSKWLAGQFALSPALDAMNELKAMENSTSKDELSFLLQAGMAYHCADLSWEERHLVEEAVKRKTIKILCATDTLSMGINLPVTNVILTGQKIISDAFSAPGKGGEEILKSYSKRALTLSEVENMGGRAGRFRGAPQNFGRIIFLAPSLIEFTAYQKLYFDHSERKAGHSLQHFYATSLEDHSQACESSPGNDHPVQVMHPDITGAAYYCADDRKPMPVTIEKDLSTFLLQKIALESPDMNPIMRMIQSLQEKQNGDFWYHRIAQKMDPEAMQTHVDHLEKEGLIQAIDEKSYALTHLGSLVIAKGISFKTYLHFQRWLVQCPKEKISDLEILFLIATSQDAENLTVPYPGLGTGKHRGAYLGKWEKYLYLRLLNLIFESGEEDKLIFRKDFHQEDATDCQIEQKRNHPLKKYLAIKKTLLMSDWINGRELRALEEDYGILWGAIQKIGEGFSWLSDTLAAIAVQIGWEAGGNDGLKKICQLSLRLATGVEPEGLALARLEIPGLTRGYIQRLVQEGYDSEQCLKELKKEQLSTVLPDLLAEKIINHLRSIKNEAKNGKNNHILSDHLTKNNKENKNENKQEEVTNHGIGFQENKNETIIRIDPDRPDQIYFFGETITINRANFQLVSLLAQNQGKMVSYEQIIDTLWPDDEDATYHRLWYHLGELRNGMQKIITRKGLAQSSAHYLKEKILKVLPGRGLLLESDIPVKIK